MLFIWRSPTVEINLTSPSSNWGGFCGFSEFEKKFRSDGWPND